MSLQMDYDKSDLLALGGKKKEADGEKPGAPRATNSNIWEPVGPDDIKDVCLFLQQ